MQGGLNIWELLQLGGHEACVQILRDGLQDCFSKINFIAAMEIDRYDCQRPLNLFSSVEELENEDISEIIPTLKDLITANKDIRLFGHRWSQTVENDALPNIFVQEVKGKKKKELLQGFTMAASSARFRLPTPSAGPEQAHFDGFMVPNLDNEIFPLQERHESLYSALVRTAQKMAQKIARARRSFTESLKIWDGLSNFKDTLAAAKDDSQMILFDEMVGKKWLPQIGGFGKTGLQIYVKHGLAYTPLHDEIANSAAINMMSSCSNGVAFWFGFRLRELLLKYGEQEVMAFMELSSGLRLFQLLRKWLNDGVEVWCVPQLPGFTVQSATLDYCHLVLTIGETCFQVAWNNSVSTYGIRSCF
eukprot:GILK01006293.1.p1 GENE.GILK01006293.1~~GILK01006293.1.p1  ORF type:complete len:361 (-),score=28.52 GILK01006293.1:497-1579(-)